MSHRNRVTLATVAAVIVATAVVLVLALISSGALHLWGVGPPTVQLAYNTEAAKPDYNAQIGKPEPLKPRPGLTDASSTPADNAEPYTDGAVNGSRTQRPPDFKQGVSQTSGALSAYDFPWIPFPKSPSRIVDTTGRTVFHTDVSGRHHDTASWDKGRASLLNVQLVHANSSISAVQAEVYLPSHGQLLRAPCYSQNDAWKATFELPLDVAPPIYLRFAADQTQWLGMLTRAHIAGQACMLSNAQKRLFGSVDASSAASLSRLPRLVCMHADGRPFRGIAAQFRMLSDGRSIDQALLGVSDKSGAIEISQLWCAGTIETFGLLLHTPGFLPVIVTPGELAAAGGKDLGVCFEHRDVVVEAPARLTGDDIALVRSAWSGYSVPLSLDIVSFANLEPDLPQIGKLLGCAMPVMDLQRSWEYGWSYDNVEQLLGRKASRDDFDGYDGLNPMELLAWYKNQRIYDEQSGVWTFALPCYGTYAIVLGIGYDSNGSFVPPLALLLNCKTQADCSIRLLK